MPKFQLFMLMSQLGTTLLRTLKILSIIKATVFEYFHLLLGPEPEVVDAVQPVVRGHQAPEEGQTLTTVSQGGAQQTRGHGAGLSLTS